MNSYYEAFLQRLIRYRIQLNLTQENASRKLGITQSQLSKQELGRTIIPYKILAKYRNMGWDLDYLFTGEKTVWKGQALSERLHTADEKDRRLILKFAVWLLEAGLEKSDIEISVEAKCEINLLKLKAECETNQSILYEIRKITGMPQLVMAEKLGVNIKKYRALEREEAKPDAELLIEIFELTRCKPSLFLASSDSTSMMIDDLWGLLSAVQQRKILTIMDKAEEFLGA